ncbi:helix-turn-helix domain-containing protein [Methylobacterium variabile]|jgi:Helix-turn-helix|uniref:helix-turn-helix domain-containing protein n=1 Tax=Methylobacterium variabile TaxID=298794 RepID=UPI000B0A606A|nr:helix-turn-helix transcriptional regulator [Methylobacterium variabile]
MKLAAYMQAEGLDDAAMAARIGPDVSLWAVRKWRYGQRIPRLGMLKRISDVTAGAVTAQDHFDAASTSSAGRSAALVATGAAA